ncbi:MAG: hypothetical protein IJA67_11050 [Oscillospiraceae bacterium]|nr:hypothetical protein [Oscillospiraceae bacterium]
MSDFEAQLNSILNDPAQMDRIAAMAKSLMGGDAPKQSEPFDLPNMGQLMASLGGGSKSDDKRALLEAMKPYLAPHRREKLDRAMKLARMIGMAETAFGMFGGDHAQI